MGLREEGVSWDEIPGRLTAEGAFLPEAEHTIRELKTAINAKKRSRGMALLAIGTAICFFSMLFTFLFGHSYVMLYGLTMVGVTIAFTGLVYVMG